MPVVRITLFDNVVDGDKLQAKLKFARSKENPPMARLEALSYLTGASKVLLKTPKREALGTYLVTQIKLLKAEIYKGDSHGD